MSSFVLKIIAIITMTIDHIGYAIFPSERIYRIIGRIAMPIFAFQIALGFKKTSSKPKYILRVFITSLVSQIPFMLLNKARHLYAHSSLKDLVLSLNFEKMDLNICFTFFLALLVLFFLEKSKENKIYILPAIYSFILSIIIPMDYGWFGVLLVVIFYYFADYKVLYIPLSIFVCLLDIYVDTLKGYELNFIQLYMAISFIFLALFNGKKGKGLKYFFYVFYPLHMLIIVLIKLNLLH